LFFAKVNCFKIIHGKAVETSVTVYQ